MIEGPSCSAEALAAGVRIEEVFASPEADDAWWRRRGPPCAGRAPR